MIKNRIKQFLLSVFCSHINSNDTEYVDKILDSYEKDIFYKLYKSEQKHSIRVSKACGSYENAIVLRKYTNVDKNRLIKAGLLHDVGKSVVKINVIEKSIFVLINCIFKYFNNKKDLDYYFKNSKKAYVFSKHPYIGYKLLKNYELDEKLLLLIKNHEEKNINDDELMILSYFDEIN